jgi:hypothetical protein
LKLVFVSALFTAALSIFGAASGSMPTSAAAPQLSAPADAPRALVANECEGAGGVCRKSACRTTERSSELECGHDLGCCLPL